MNTIWKYELKNADAQDVEMPVGSNILTVQVQYNIPCLWAIVDPDCEKTEKRSFVIYGTGHPIHGSPGIYIGTYQLYEGQLVFHVFEDA